MGVRDAVTFLSLTTVDGGILVTARCDDDVWANHRADIERECAQYGYRVRVDNSGAGLTPSKRIQSLAELFVWVADQGQWESGDK
jgi:hypothetical protein